MTIKELKEEFDAFPDSMQVCFAYRPDNIAEASDEEICKVTEIHPDGDDLTENYLLLS